AALEEPAAEAPGSGKPVTVQVRPMEDVSNAYRVVLSIAEGYHLNANPASLDGLVATTVSAEGGEVEVTYPPAAIERYLFTDEPLSVYEGRIEIMVQADSSVDAITLTTQACTDSACLAPETRTLKLP
ncbi:MAG: protein-disulfide reductase DsbD domain-containing protein, partial [Planctomycetota bacterium]